MILAQCSIEVKEKEKKEDFKAEDGLLQLDFLFVCLYNDIWFWKKS